MQTMEKYRTHDLAAFIAIFIIMHVGAWFYNTFFSEPPLSTDFVLGMGLGAALTIFICYRSLLKKRADSKYATLPITIASITTLLALPFTMILGTYLGGTMGAGFVSLLLQAVLHVQSITLLGVGTWLGIGFGSFIVAVLPTLFATNLGYAAGRILQKRFWPE